MNLRRHISEARLDGRRCSPGLFAVEHVPTGRRLICATGNLSKRLCDQARYLLRGRHYNPGIQADLLRDGHGSFRFVLLQLVRTPSDLKLLKRMYIQCSRAEGKSYHSDEPVSRCRLDLHEAEPLGNASLKSLPEEVSCETVLKKLAEFKSLFDRRTGLATALLDRLVGDVQPPIE
jgi:hypothetical protein